MLSNYIKYISVKIFRMPHRSTGEFQCATTPFVRDIARRQRVMPSAPNQGKIFLTPIKQKTRQTYEWRVPQLTIPSRYPRPPSFVRYGQQGNCPVTDTQISDLLCSFLITVIMF